MAVPILQSLCADVLYICGYVAMHVGGWVGMIAQ